MKFTRPFRFATLLIQLVMLIVGPGMAWLPGQSGTNCCCSLDVSSVVSTTTTSSTASSNRVVAANPVPRSCCQAKPIPPTETGCCGTSQWDLDLQQCRCGCSLLDRAIWVATIPVKESDRSELLFAADEHESASVGWAGLPQSNDIPEQTSTFSASSPQRFAATSSQRCRQLCRWLL